MTDRATHRDFLVRDHSAHDQRIAEQQSPTRLQHAENFTQQPEAPRHMTQHENTASKLSSANGRGCEASHSWNRQSAPNFFCSARAFAFRIPSAFRSKPTTL